MITQNRGTIAFAVCGIFCTLEAALQSARALTAQGRFEALAMSLAPLVAFLLLFFINNDLMLPMVQTTVGWCAIGVMLTLELIGYFVIRSIVNIEV